MEALELICTLFTILLFAYVMYVIISVEVRCYRQRTRIELFDKVICKGRSYKHWRGQIFTCMSTDAESKTMTIINDELKKLGWQPQRVNMSDFKKKQS